MKTTRRISLGVALAATLLQGCSSLPGARQNQLVAGDSGRVLPEKIECRSRIDAYIAGLSYAADKGGSMVTTSGTPSMEPLIHGRTFAVIQQRPYASIAKDDLLVYLGRPDASKPDRLRMLHRAVARDRHGWIMSGDNNRWTESWDRVTPETYVGVVVALFAYPQS